MESNWNKKTFNLIKAIAQQPLPAIADFSVKSSFNFHNFVYGNRKYDVPKPATDE